MNGHDKLLFLGCEALGLERQGCFFNVPSEFDDESGAYFQLEENHPALPSHVASLLVDRVWHRRGLDYECDAGHFDCAVVQFSNEPTAKGHTVYLRGLRDDWVVLTIAAALVALGKLTREEAREMLEAER